MKDYEDFLLELSSILPLPKDNVYISADGTTEVDLKKASKNIARIIKKYKKGNNLTAAEIIKLKQLAIERYYDYLKAWKNKKEPR